MARPMSVSNRRGFATLCAVSCNPPYRYDRNGVGRSWVYVSSGEQTRMKNLPIVSHQRPRRIIANVDEGQGADIVNVAPAEIVTVFDFPAVLVAVGSGERESTIEIIESVGRGSELD